MNSFDFSQSNEKLYKKLLLEIKNYWEDLNRCEMTREEIKTPWFGSIQFQAEEVKKKISKKLFERFPAAIRNNLHEIECDLDYLLPQTDLVKAFLPVLINGYLSNYHRYKFFCKRLSEEACDNIQVEFVNQVFSTKPVPEKYAKLAGKDCKSTNTARTLSAYLQVIQFFMLIKCTSHLCNVNLSFYCFDNMTDYLYLLEEPAYFYLEKLREAGYERLFAQQQPYCGDPSPDKILHYIDSTLSDLKYLRGPSSGKKVQSSKYLAFVYNLKCALSPEEILPVPVEKTSPEEDFPFDSQDAFSVISFFERERADKLRGIDPLDTTDDLATKEKISNP